MIILIKIDNQTLKEYVAPCCLTWLPLSICGYLNLMKIRQNLKNNFSVILAICQVLNSLYITSDFCTDEEISIITKFLLYNTGLKSYDFHVEPFS